MPTGATLAPAHTDSQHRRQGVLLGPVAVLQPTAIKNWRSRNMDDSAASGECKRLCPVPGAKLGEDVLDVDLDSLRRNVERFCNLPVLHPHRSMAKDLDFAVRQRRRSCPVGQDGLNLSGE